MQEENPKNKKIMGAILSCLFYCGVCMIPMVAVILSQIAVGEKMPIVAFIVFLIIIGILLGGNILCLVYRLQEIRDGEEEDASIY